MASATEEPGEPGDLINDERIIETVREKGLDKEDLNRIVNDLEEEESAIDIPERNELFTDNVKTDSIDQLAEVNGIECHPFFVYLVNMINNGLTPVIAVCGKEGLGKSMSANVVADTLHKMSVLRGEYEPESQVVYDPLEFGLLLRNSTRKLIFFEEAGETVNKNDYNSRLNQMVAGAIRTQRKRENPYLFVTPDFEELDPRIREKTDVLIEMKDEQEAEITIYEKKHGRRGNRGLSYFFDTNLPPWKVPDLPEELQERYDKIDNAFKGSYLDDLILDAVKEKKERLQEDNTASL